MLRYKVTPPPLPRCVDRPRLLDGLRRVPVTVLAAPAGHGKTCLAAQVAAATGGPTAWFLADEMDRDRAGVVAQLFSALGRAWPDLGDSEPVTLDDDSAVPQLGAALETLAGPGCLVMDDVHLLPGDVFDAVLRTAVAALPADCHLVVCTRGTVPEEALRAETTDRAITVGPEELVFDADECEQVCGSPGRGVEIHARTGGWPLAVMMMAQGPGSPSPAGLATHAGRLAELALADLVPAARSLLGVLSRLPRFPAPLLKRLGDPSPALAAFGTRHPWLFSIEDGWWAPREWLRDALRAHPPDAGLLARVVGALRELDAEELAAQLLLAEARYEEAAPLVERLASEGLRLGRAAWVHALIASVPSSARPFALDLLVATAAQALNLTDQASDVSGSELALLDLVDRAAAAGPGAQLRARALVASHYRMEGDTRFLAVCEEALGAALQSENPEDELRGRWPPEDAPAAAELLRLYGYALLFSDDRRSVDHGRRLIAAALDLLDGAGRPTTSQRGWLAYFEVLLFLRRARDAVRPMRLAAHRVSELDHAEGPLRLAELATVEYFAGDPSARRTIEIARVSADRTGNRIALVPLASIEVALDVLDSGFAPEHQRRFDDILARLETQPRLAPFADLIAAEFGTLLVRHGEVDLARRYLGRGAPLGAGLFARLNSLRWRRLQGLVLLVEGRTGEGRAQLEALRTDAAGEGRGALVELVDADLAQRSGDPSVPGPSATDRRASPVVVHVLAPELSVTVDGDGVPAPRGYPARLLALLVASGGSITVDRAIEGLWPGADPDVGRNRLHGVLLRLRRSLGLAADGPITCTEGVVRAEHSSHLVVDSWEFERLAARSDTQPKARVDAITAYRGDVLSVQFAYDDTVDTYRRELRRMFLDVATAVLECPLERMDPDDLVSIARRAWRTERGDEHVCLSAVRTLARLGHRAEACELVDLTAAALVENGLDPDDFRCRARIVTDHPRGAEV